MSEKYRASRRVGTVRMKKGKKSRKGSKPHAVKVRPNQGPISDVYIANFTFADTTLTWSAPGFFGLSFRYRINSCFDPDPVVGGNSVVGWTEFTELYDRYRVHAVHYEWTIANRNTDSLLAGVLPTATDVGTYTTSGSVGLALAQPRARSKMLAISGGGTGTVTMRGRLTMEDVFGTKEYRYDDVHSAEMGANPGRVGMLNFLISSPVALLYGITTYLRIIYEVELYRRESLMTPAFKKKDQVVIKALSSQVVSKQMVGSNTFLLVYEDGQQSYVDENGVPVDPPLRVVSPPKKGSF